MIERPAPAELAARVRKAIFDRFLAATAPPVLEELMVDFSLSRAEASDILQTLQSARHIALVPGTDRILMAFPFSAVVTPFRVVANGRRYFANCAWDAIAFHAMLDSDIEVESFCHHCGEPIHLEMSGGRTIVAEPGEALVYLAVPAAQWWENIVTTCGSTMVFFSSPQHRDVSALHAGRGASLTPDQTHRLSVLTYARKLALDYARPTKQDVVDHFARIGLSGEFWSL